MAAEHYVTDKNAVADANEGGITEGLNRYSDIEKGGVIPNMLLSYTKIKNWEDSNEKYGDGYIYNDGNND